MNSLCSPERHFWLPQPAKYRSPTCVEGQACSNNSGFMARQEKTEKVSNSERKGNKLTKHSGTAQGRPQETEASNLERWVKLARPNPGNHTEESSLCLWGHVGDVQRLRQVILAEGQRQHRELTKVNRLQHSRAELGRKGHWSTGQGEASRARPRSLSEI